MRPTKVRITSEGAGLKVQAGALLIGVGLAFAASAATIRVPQDQPSIQAAVNAANAGDTVLVSSGTYNEHNIQINKSMTVVSVGGPTNTIVDSQHNGKGFIVTPPVSGTVNIIGFTIQNGQTLDYDAGGAVDVTSGYCRISRCIIQGVSGPSDYSYMPINNNNGTNNVLVDSCIVRSNFAANGAGIGSCTVSNCWIYNNTGGNNCGALWDCNATNCTICGNGGGYLSNPWTVGGANGGNYDNCIFWNNLPSYNNQELYQPSSVSYCIVMGGYSGTGNLSSDPLFVNAASGNFSLQTNSPALGAGDPAIRKPNGSRSDIGASGDISGPVPVSILRQPAGETGYWGMSASFSVQVQGIPPFSYQWFVDGFPITWATNATLTLTNLDSTDAGSYTVTISNVVNSVTSAPALLIVNPAGISLGLYAGVTVSGVVGRTYGIQYSTNVSATNSWTAVTNLTLTQPVQTWVDTAVDTHAAGNVGRFYRVVAIP